jgi:uncharacterized membrane protein YwzB
MKKIMLVHIMLVSFVWNGFSQSIDYDYFIVQKDSAQYKIQTLGNDISDYYILSYKIYNKSDSTIWLWFEGKDNLYGDKKMKEYFFRHKGNINLFHVLTDANVYVQDSIPILFNTFLKYIEKHNSFTIQIFCTKDVFIKKESIFDYLDEHIVVESDKTLSKFLGINTLTKWKRIKFYEEDFIILPVDLFGI